MSQPAVSIILCTYNRAKLLKQALESLSRLSSPDVPSREILIVDNNSTDDTALVARDYARRDPTRFRLIDEKRQGKSFALNTGIQKARGEILAFTDDDVTFDSHWLLELVRPFQQPECLGVGGKIVPVWPIEKPGWLQLEGPYRLMSAIVSFDLGDEPCPIKTPPYGANMAFRRQAFQKYGLFRTDLGPTAGTEIRGEDTEFCWRLIDAGEPLTYAPGSIVYHPVEKNRMEKGFFSSWYYDYGRASIRQKGIPSGAFRLFGIPVYHLFKSLPLNAFKWVFALSPARRLYYKLNACLVAGKIAESFALRRSDPTPRKAMRH
jgi:glycosyltransferase involved in cell wall biosynthesis